MPSFYSKYLLFGDAVFATNVWIRTKNGILGLKNSVVPKQWLVTYCINMYSLDSPLISEYKLLEKYQTEPTFYMEGLSLVVWGILFWTGFQNIHISLREKSKIGPSFWSDFLVTLEKLTIKTVKPALSFSKGQTK